jgi:hypothetical protein
MLQLQSAGDSTGDLSAGILDLQELRSSLPLQIAGTDSIRALWGI